MRVPAGWLAPALSASPSPWAQIVADRRAGMAIGIVLAAVSAWSSGLEWWHVEPDILAKPANQVQVTAPQPIWHEIANLEGNARPSRLDFAPMLQSGPRTSTEPASEMATRALTSARRAIARGDIVGARALLAEAAAEDHAEALVVLAETYDPRMLAAWGTRGVAADRIAAITYYARAHAAGHPTATARLQALE